MFGYLHRQISLLWHDAKTLRHEIIHSRGPSPNLTAPCQSSPESATPDKGTSHNRAGPGGPCVVYFTEKKFGHNSSCPCKHTHTGTSCTNRKLHGSRPPPPPAAIPTQLLPCGRHCQCRLQPRYSDLNRAAPLNNPRVSPESAIAHPTLTLVQRDLPSRPAGDRGCPAPA